MRVDNFVQRVADYSGSAARVVDKLKRDRLDQITCDEHGKYAYTQPWEHTYGGLETSDYCHVDFYCYDTPPAECANDYS